MPIFNSYSIDEIENPRLQRIRLKTTLFNFTVSWQAGKDHCAPDALSRSPVSFPEEDDCLDEGDVSSFICAIRSDVNPAISLEQLKQAQMKDTEIIALKQTIDEGWPTHKIDCSDRMRAYWHMRHHFTVIDNIVLCGVRTVVPRNLRSQIIKILHEGHMGIEKMKRRARESVYWPGINAEIKNVSEKCENCIRNLPSHAPEPIQPRDIPSRPWDKIGSDLFEYASQHYLIITDYTSFFPEVWMLGRDSTAPQVINKLKESFARFGVPQEVVSDNGSQYRSKLFEEFSKVWGFKWNPSSSRYPQSNGKAEAAVKAVKAIIKKCKGDIEQCRKGLLAFRNTPLANGLSPAEILFGRKLRDTLPIHPNAYRKAQNRIAANTENNSDVSAAPSYPAQAQRYNTRAKRLPALTVNSHVVVQHYRTKEWSLRGKIVEVLPHRAYKIKLSNRQVITRNRRFIRKVTAPIAHPSTPTDPVPVLPPVSVESTPPTSTVVTVPSVPKSMTRSGRTITRPSRFNDFVPR